MNESISYMPNAVPLQQPCSETKCITCFENRGCMYDLYLLAAAVNMEVSLPKQSEEGNMSKFVS